jgi:hypothetical protein
MWFFVDCTKEQVYFVRAGDLADEIECFLVLKDGFGHGALRPNHEIDARCRRERYFAQPRKLIEDCLLITDIEFFRARHASLHQSDVQRP